MTFLYEDDCVFCQKVLDGSATICTTSVFRFEPLNPVTPGHMLFIPRYHTEHGFDEDYLGKVFAAAAKWGYTRREQFNLITSSGEAATQTVPHMHVHYVPRTPADGLSLPWTGQHTKVVDCGRTGCCRRIGRYAHTKDQCCNHPEYDVFHPGPPQERA